MTYRGRAVYRGGHRNVQRRMTRLIDALDHAHGPRRHAIRLAITRLVYGGIPPDSEYPRLSQEGLEVTKRKYGIEQAAMDAWTEMAARLGTKLLHAFYTSDDEDEHRAAVLVTRTPDDDGVLFEFLADSTPDEGYAGRHRRNVEDDDG